MVIRWHHHVRVLQIKWFRLIRGFFSYFVYESLDIFFMFILFVLSSSYGREWHTVINILVCLFYITSDVIVQVRVKQTFLDTLLLLSTGDHEGGPDGMDFDKNGNLLVANWGSSHIEVYSPDGGDPIHRIKCPFSKPSNLHFRPGSNEVYVTEHENHALWTFKWECQGKSQYCELWFVELGGFSLLKSGHMSQGIMSSNQSFVNSRFTDSGWCNRTLITR